MSAFLPQKGALGRGYELDKRREPHVERERIAPIPPEALRPLSFLVLDKSEINPSGKEPKLDAHVRVARHPQNENVGDEQVDAGEDFDFEFQQAGEELDLVFGNELGEGDEEADLEAAQAVDGRSIPVRTVKRSQPFDETIEEGSEGKGERTWT